MEKNNALGAQKNKENCRIIGEYVLKNVGIEIIVSVENGNICLIK